MRTTERRLCGHPSTGPSGVCDQSLRRIRSPISPPPENTSPAAGRSLPAERAEGAASSVTGRAAGADSPFAVERVGSDAEWPDVDLSIGPTAPVAFTPETLTGLCP